MARRTFTLVYIHLYKLIVNSYSMYLLYMLWWAGWEWYWEYWMHCYFAYSVNSCQNLLKRGWKRQMRQGEALDADRWFNGSGLKGCNDSKCCVWPWSDYVWIMGMHLIMIPALWLSGWLPLICECHSSRYLSLHQHNKWICTHLVGLLCCVLCIIVISCLGFPAFSSPKMDDYVHVYCVCRYGGVCVGGWCRGQSWPSYLHLW